MTLFVLFLILTLLVTCRQLLKVRRESNKNLLKLQDLEGARKNRVSGEDLLHETDPNSFVAQM